MASLKKFTDSAVVNLIRHIERVTVNPSNKDIDTTRTEWNYTLSPDRGMSAYSYYLYRKSQLYCFGRADVKTLAGWVVTAPSNLPVEQQQKFFHESYQFLENRYRQENVVMAVVHHDENQPHLHFLFIPAVPDPKHGGEKICANELITRAELRDFHPALQKYLKSERIHACVFNDTSSPHSAKNYKFERKFESILRKGREEK